MTTQSKSLRLDYKRTTFGTLPVGTEFFWGGFGPERSNWGRKRSGRTADYRPRLGGVLTDWSEWAFWRQTDPVYVANREGEQ